MYKNIKAIDIEWEILYHNLYYVKGSVRNMEKILNVAEYIFKEYQRVTGEYIDEMKLQKLLYFSQRESLAILNKPMFSEKFEGWK